MGVDPAQRLRLLQDELEEDVGEVQVRERRDAGEELIEDDAQAVDVGSPVEGLPLRLLGGEVGRRAADHPGPRKPGLALFQGEAEVDDERVELARLVARQEDVGGLEIAVDEAGLVGGVDGSRDVSHEPQLGGERQRLGELAQVLAVDVLHGDERPAGDLPHLVHLADARVGDARLGPGLAQEPVGLLVVVSMQELERHVAAEGGVESQEHRAHAAAAEQALDPVAGPVGEEAVLRGKGGLGKAFARELGAPLSAGEGIVRTQARGAAVEVRGVVRGAFELGGEGGDGRRGQTAGGEERLDPALLRVGGVALLAVRGQTLGDGIEVFPAQETPGDRQPEKAALPGFVHGRGRCEATFSLSRFAFRRAGGNRAVRSAPPPSSPLMVDKVNSVRQHDY